MTSAPYPLQAVDAETLGGLGASAYALAARSPASLAAHVTPGAGGVSVDHAKPADKPASDVTGTGTAGTLPVWINSFLNSPTGGVRCTLESMGAARHNEMLQAGQSAPDFKLARLEKGTVEGTADLGKLLPGGPVLLAFFKSTCPVCQMTLPFLERIHNDRAPGSFAIYGVSQDDAETTEEFAGEFGIGFPMLLDTEESGYPASNAYGISHVPSLFLVERDGTIARSMEGFNKKEFLELAGQAGVNPFRPDEKVPEWKAG